MNRPDEADRQFHRAYYGDSNFMTPNICYRTMVHDCRAVELSWGRGMFNRGWIYGVTVVEDGVPQHKLSKCFDSKAKAERYITEEL